MLSKKNRYAFHALEFLARHRNEGPQRVEFIAMDRQIPRKFLEAILLEMKRAGILGSKKGKGGGYYLLKEPKDVHFAEVIRLMDGPIAYLPCVSLNYYEKCADCVETEESCMLRRTMIRVRDETLNVLENATLHDLIR